MMMQIKIGILALAVLIMGLSGCTADDPGYTAIVGNPEVKVVDSNGDIITIDEVTGALTTISFTHYEVHEGSSFISDTFDLTLNDGETIILVFKTMPAPTRVHIFVEFTTLVGGDLRVWEGAGWTTGTGTLNPIINRKRETTMARSGVLEDKTATPAFTATNNILVNPVGLATGSAINIHHFYAWGRKEKILAGNVRDTEEFILKPETQYAVVFTADGGANKAQVILNWYEHTDNG